ncbi:DUF4214 domain-containing protein (plasmid) [Massilia varians]
MTYNEAVVYVTDLYRMYVGREPDSAGLEFWASALVNGQVTRASAATSLANSPEASYYSMYLTTSVEDAYWGELGRLADSAGLAYWLDVLRNGLSIENLRAALHGSQEAADFRARLSQLPQVDPRLAAMRQFGADGNAVVPYQVGDSLATLSEKAYGTKAYWWVIGQANNAVVDRELSGASKIIIPDLRQTSANANAIELDDNGFGKLYVNRLTGDQFTEYYTLAVSQLDPLEFEPNPNWLSGLAFVNGNDLAGVAADFASRHRPFPTMPAGYWEAVKKGLEVPPISIDLPDNLDLSYINSLPIVTPPAEGMPPPPYIRVAPGADSQKAIDEVARLPKEIQNTLRIARVEIVAFRESIVEVFDELKGKPIPNWPRGYTWDSAPGIFDPNSNKVGFATFQKPQASSSVNVFRHEIGHAYDYNMGDISKSPMFEAAFKKDYEALLAADSISYYYTKPDRSEPDPSKRTYARAQSETYAESFAAYYSGRLSWFRDKPNLLNYFKNLPRPVQPSGR